MWYRPIVKTLSTNIYHLFQTFIFLFFSQISELENDRAVEQVLSAQGKQKSGKSLGKNLGRVTFMESILSTFVS